MLAKKKISTQAEENFSDENSMILTPEESVHFKNEIEKQLAETKIIDIGKAARNARYLAMIDKSKKQLKEGKVVSFTDEEWEKFINE